MDSRFNNFCSIHKPENIKLDVHSNRIKICVYGKKDLFPSLEVAIYPDGELPESVMEFYDKLDTLPTTEEELDDLSYKIVEKDGG